MARTRGGPIAGDAQHSPRASEPVPPKGRQHRVHCRRDGRRERERTQQESGWIVSSVLNEYHEVDGVDSGFERDWVRSPYPWKYVVLKLAVDVTQAAWATLDTCRMDVGFPKTIQRDSEVSNDTCQFV